MQMELPSEHARSWKPRLSDFTCWTVHTDLQQIGGLAFAPPTDDAQKETQAAMLRNYDATVLTAEANYISFPTDCPHRERRGWLGERRGRLPL